MLQILSRKKKSKETNKQKPYKLLLVMTGFCHCIYKILGLHMQYTEFAMVRDTEGGGNYK